jgi:hypothetical protein
VGRSAEDLTRQTTVEIVGDVREVGADRVLTTPVTLDPR